MEVFYPHLQPLSFREGRETVFVYFVYHSFEGFYLYLIHAIVEFISISKMTHDSLENEMRILFEKFQDI